VHGWLLRLVNAGVHVRNPVLCVVKI